MTAKLGRRDRAAADLVKERDDDARSWRTKVDERMESMSDDIGKIGRGLARVEGIVQRRGLGR